jgi:hypothetical protein
LKLDWRRYIIGEMGSRSILVSLEDEKFFMGGGNDE